MPTNTEIRQTVLTCFEQFLESTGRTGVTITDRSDLTRDLGMCSDEGVDFAIELCRAFAHQFPNDFNPFVHDHGRRGRRVGEMVDAVAAHLPTPAEVAR